MRAEHAVDKQQPVRDAPNLRTRETANELMRAIQFLAGGNPAVFGSLNFRDRSDASQKT